MQPATVRKPTAQQRQIYRHLAGTRSVAVRAGAGCGKTTTLIDGLAQIPGRALVTAFNKKIASELAERIGPTRHVVGTAHQYGFRTLRDQWGAVSLDKASRPDFLAVEIRKSLGLAVKDGVIGAYCRILSRCRNVLAESIDDVSACIAAVDPPLSGDEIDAAPQHIIDILRRLREPRKNIDFDDMLWLPAVHGMYRRNEFAAILIDEAQDWNAAQRAMMMVGERAVIVGDPRQAIYGFRGADYRSMQVMSESVDAITLPLSETFRCGAEIVRYANAIEPSLRARGTHEGIVRVESDPDAAADAMQPGDMVLGRTNVIVVAGALAQLRRNRKAYVIGRSLAQRLLPLVKDFSKRCRTLAEFDAAVEAHRARECERLEKYGRYAPKALQVMHDICDTLLELSTGCASVAAIADRIESLFSDVTDKNAIAFGTGHAAKGLESDRVWVLGPELFPHPMAQSADESEQELNLLYVVVTRAKSELVFVGSLPSPLRGV